MIELDPRRFRTQPFAHQLVGTRALLANPAFALFDEMGVGKSKQVVDAACALFDAEQIEAVVVIAPATVRSVWLDEELGEIAKHSWVAVDVAEFHQRGVRTAWRRGGLGVAHPLIWIVTNYAFIRETRPRGLGFRRRSHLEELVKALGDRRFLLVLDESSFIKNRTAARTKACQRLRERAARVVLLNGTPIVNSPLDLWAQFRVLDERALPFRNFYAFRARYAVMGGWQGKVPIAWQHLDELQRRLAPYVLRREKRDCLDLPPKLYTTLEVPLSPASWKLYKDMRDEMVAWLDAATPVLAPQAIVKILRLAQITSGFLGGLKEGTEDEEVALPPREIGREKLSVLLGWLKELFATSTERDMRILIWCRFRAELKRAAAHIDRLRGGGITEIIMGGQTLKQRAEVVRWFQEPTITAACQATRVLVAQPQAGGFGLNLTACHRVVYLSNDFNLLTRLQSEDRVHRPGQERNVTYIDILATGPEGGRTIDGAILRALRKKEEVARWTTDAWRRALLEERE